MNHIQIEFSNYWDKIANTVFYKAAIITENSGFADKILDNQRNELSTCIKEEINKTFFDAKMRPKATVWLENLGNVYPEETARFEKLIRNCELTSKGYENILTIAAGGTVVAAGAMIGKRNHFASAILVLGGVAVSGCKIISCLNDDTDTLQGEVKKQFEIWRTFLLNILATCYDVDPV